MNTPNYKGITFDKIEQMKKNILGEGTQEVLEMAEKYLDIITSSGDYAAGYKDGLNARD